MGCNLVFPGGRLLAIRYLEKPKGCLKTLRLLHEQGEVTIRDIMRKTSLSQNGAYSTLDHLVNLDLIEPLAEKTSRGMPKTYGATGKGEELLFHLSLFFDTLRIASGKDDIVACLGNPYCTLEILLKAYCEGSVTLTSLVGDKGMCKSTAHMGLQNLAELGLLRMKTRKGFRLTRKEYSLTAKGQIAGKVLFLVNEKMRSITKLRQA